MAVTVRILVQIILVIILRSEETIQRKQFHRKGRYPQPMPDVLKNFTKDGKVLRVNKVYAGTVTSAFIFPLLIQTKRVYYFEIQLSKPM